MIFYLFLTSSLWSLFPSFKPGSSPRFFKVLLSVLAVPSTTLFQTEIPDVVPGTCWSPVLALFPSPSPSPLVPLSALGVSQSSQLLPSWCRHLSGFLHQTRLFFCLSTTTKSGWLAIPSLPRRMLCWPFSTTFRFGSNALDLDLLPSALCTTSRCWI